MYKLIKHLFIIGTFLVFAVMIYGKYKYGIRYGKPNFTFVGRFVLSIPDEDIIMNLYCSKLNSIENSWQILDKETYRNIVSWLGQQSGSRLSPYLIILFFKGHFSDSSRFTGKDIACFSVYSLKGDKMFHRFYKRNGEQFIEKGNYNCEVYGILCDHPYLILKNEVNGRRNSFLRLKSELTPWNRDRGHRREELLERLRVENAEKAGNI